MSEAYDKVRPEVLAAAEKTGRFYPHEGRAVARELIELRNGGTDADALRWRWFSANLHRMAIEYEYDGHHGPRVSRIEVAPEVVPGRPEAFVAAVDAAMKEHP